MEISSTTAVLLSIIGIAAILSFLLLCRLRAREKQDLALCETATQKKLSASEENYHRLLEVAPVPMWINQKGCIIYMNPAGMRLLGALELQQVIGLPAMKFIHPDYHASVGERIALLMSGEVSVPLREEKYIRLDGSVVDVDVTATSYETPEGLATQVWFQDISDRKRSEQALRENEEKYRNLVEFAPVAMYTAQNSVITYVNPTAMQVLGASAPEQVIGKSTFDIIHPDFHLIVKQRMTELLDHNKVAPSLFEKYVRMDGSFVDVEVTAISVNSSSGRFTQVIFQDITQRLQAEMALRESEALYHDLVETSQDLIWQSDTEGRYVYLNSAMEDVFGYKLEEMLGRPFWDFMPPEAAQINKEFYGQFSPGKTVKGYESPFIRKDGRTIYLVINSKYIQDAEGNFAGTRGTAYDITERRKAEKALGENEEKYRRLVEISPVPMYTSLDAVITYMNPTALQIFGASSLDDVLGRSSFDFIHPEYHEIVKERISSMVDQEKIAPMLEEKYLRLDGTAIDVEVIATPFDTTAGRATQILFQDITKRKQEKEEREKLIKELEAKNAELERFAYTVSHDLKAPIVTIRGFLGFMERNINCGNVAQTKSDMVRISAATDRIYRLLNELLELSRIGRVTNAPEALSFGTIVRNAIMLVQGRITESKARIIVAPDLPVVNVDRVRIIEVVQNLLDNACKFVSGSCEPCIEIGMKGEDSDGKTIFFVRDNGIGIESRYLDQVFGLFNKLDPNTEGTGVGLALVKRIVEAHKGRIWVESEFGVGSTFYFTL